MGVEGTCRSSNGGGCPFLQALHIARAFLCSCSRLLHHSKRAKRHRNRAKRGKNEFFLGVSWCFLGDFGDNKGRNTNIFLKCRKKNRCGGGRLPAFHCVHWCRGVPDSGPSGPAGVGSGPLVVCSPLFVRFVALLVWLLANMPLFRVFRAFLAWFGGLVWVCVALLLCVACVGFVRVWS